MIILAKELTEVLVNDYIVFKNGLSNEQTIGVFSRCEEMQYLTVKRLKLVQLRETCILQEKVKTQLKSVKS